MIVWERKQEGFTIVELLIVVVVIAILAAITIVSFNGIQARARDSARIENIQAIAKAIELYKVDNNQYPVISDAFSSESSGCGSATQNWGHCDRFKQLSDFLAPYMKLDPTSLSSATVGDYGYRYTSQSGDNFQSYGMSVNLEGNGGANDGGYFANAFEVGPKPSYCMNKYSGASANWTVYVNVCSGGN
jgi:prepilin-type N-terminal cleavage/methylation domain-containing protein